MPELPEVEILRRHLAAVLAGKTIRAVRVLRPKVLGRTSVAQLRRALRGARFASVERRGKYLLFRLTRAGVPGGPSVQVVGHLGMTGGMYLASARAPLPRHVAVWLDLGRKRFVYEDPRYFGRFTLDSTPLTALGPEPFEFTREHLASALRRSTQAIKVKLLDQRLVAGLGNIYAAEALFRARIAPTRSARALSPAEVARLWRAIRAVLRHAVRNGSTMPLHHGPAGGRDGLFYFGRAPDAPAHYRERLRVYDRAGHPCVVCGAVIHRLVQAGRSTFYCPRCQLDRARSRVAAMLARRPGLRGVAIARRLTRRTTHNPLGTPWVGESRRRAIGDPPAKAGQFGNLGTPAQGKGNRELNLCRIGP